MSASTARLKPKHTRAHNKKSRKGCLTCKIRRVKCDETKPTCRRCDSFGAGGCEYTAAQNPHEKPFVSIQPRSKHFLKIGNSEQSFAQLYPQYTLIGAKNPSASVPGDLEERRYFELFREKVAFVICGYFETPFWTRFIPQLCHHEPTIRHEIVALSALWKSSANEKGDSQSRKDSFKRLAFQYQSKALGHLRSSLSGGSQVRLAVIASLLFGCFETLHGNWENATQQFYSGQRLLREWKVARRDRSLAKNSIYSPPPIDPEIPPALARFEMHMMTFLIMNPVYSPPFDEDYEEIVGWLDHFPDRFVSLTMAFPYASQMAILVLKALRKSVRYSSSVIRRSPGTSIPHEKDALALGSEIWNRAWAKWNRVFGRLYEEQNLEVPTEENLGILQCHICGLVFETIIQTIMDTDESCFDNYLERFRFMVSSARFLYQTDLEFRLLGEPVLQFGIGQVMCLYYCATRCRDRALRQDAISILRQFPSHNGVWDSSQAAEVANWVANLEEDGRNETGIIPEDWRVRMHTLKWTVEDGGHLKVECMQGLLSNELKVRKAMLIF